MASVMSLMFDLSTPDKEFPGFVMRVEDQLPGRPLNGMISIAAVLGRLEASFTGEWQVVNGRAVFDHLMWTGAPVLGSNVGEFLYQNQHLIPASLRGRAALAFWGSIYSNSEGARYIWLLCWKDDEGWVWCGSPVDDDFWSDYELIVM